MQEGNAGCVLEEHGKVVGKLMGLTYSFNSAFFLSIWKTTLRFMTRAKKRAEGWPAAGVYVEGLVLHTPADVGLHTLEKSRNGV